MKAVILCGGKGTRMREETEYRPKPLVLIDGYPILWHIMNIYSQYGVNEFVLCLGYKGDMIKEYFNNILWRHNDYTIHLNNKKKGIEYHSRNYVDWKITMIDTGEETLTGGRLRIAMDYIEEEEFFMTYGDGVSDVNIEELYEFHKRSGKVATLTGVNPVSSYGIIGVEDGEAKSFLEKPKVQGVVNGGFMVLKKSVVDYFPEKDCMFVQEPLKNIVFHGQLAVYEHGGYWKAIDTFKDVKILNAECKNGNYPWIRGD